MDKTTVLLYITRIVKPLTRTIDILLGSLRTDYLAPSNVLLKPRHDGIDYIRRELPAVNQYTGGKLVFQRQGMLEEIVRDGEGILIRSDQTYRSRNLAPGLTRRRGIAFSFSMMGGVDPLALLETPFILDRSAAASIGSINRALFATAERGNFLEEVAGKAELGMRLFAKIVSISRLKPDAASRLENIERLQKAFGYIRDNLTNPIRIEKLAKLSALSPSRFRAIFHHSVGVSPNQYIINLRLARAQEMLMGELPICEIADRTGFREQYYFSRLFRKKLGISPSRFRTENRIG